MQNNLLDYGEAVVKAVTNYIGVPYIPATPGTDNNIYIVKKGDSLYSIANKYGITVNELKAANNLTSNLLNVGQTLIIPTINPDITLPENYIVYTVKKGDRIFMGNNEYRRKLWMDVNHPYFIINKIICDIINKKSEGV